MTVNITRRSFLKWGVAAAGTLAAKPISAAISEPDQSLQLATLIDISKCVGCGACVETCAEVNADKYPNPQKPFPKMIPARVPVEDWSDKQDVTDRLTPYNWLYIQNATVELDGEETELTIPRRCMHCVNPPCVKLCPFGAAHQHENGSCFIDPDICVGGAKCKNVCPWKIPQRQTGTGLYLDLLPSLAGNGVMYKCNRCYERIEKGELATCACIEACPEDVQTIGPRDDIIRQAHTLAKEMNGYIYGEQENGGTNTIYVSPVPFEKINQAIEKGKGKPHFNSVKDAMKKANNLAVAMLVAPLAGIAASVGKLYKLSRPSKKEYENAG